MGTPNIFERVKRDPKFSPDNSSRWFRGRMAALTNGTTYNIEPLMRNRKLDRFVLPGNMYAFKYDALHKATLPYFDQYPLVIPFRRKGIHFWGLNLHYVHPYTRGLLFDKLQQFKDPKDRMMFTWRLVKSGNFPGAHRCVKQYLLTQVRSQFLKIEEEEWKIALFLPFQKFIGASSEQVWRSSSR